jgi:purine-nucleoside phosphorylase
MNVSSDFFYQMQNQVHQFCKTESISSVEIENQQKYFTDIKPKN